MKNNFHSQKAWHPTEVYKLISRIQNVKKRNLLRGYATKPHITSHDAEIIRRENSPHDSIICGALLKGPFGLLNEQEKKKKRTSNDLFTMTSFPPIDWRNEVCYTAGYMNSMNETVSDLFHIIKSLARLDIMDSDFALNLLLDLSKKHGASNYLSYKLAYLRSTRDLSPISS